MRGGVLYDLFYAIEKNDLEMVKKALNGEPVANVTQITRVMPFSGKPNVNGKKLIGGNTPLMVAIQKYSNLEIVELLITNGADVNLTNSHGDTALHLALLHENIIKKRFIYDNQFNTFKLLIDKGADVNIQNKDGNTPLHLALNDFEKNLEIVKLLIDKGANVNIKGKKSPLHLALTNIIYANGIDENGNAKKDMYNKFDIIELLIENDADVQESIEIKNEPYSLWDIAYIKKDNKVMKILDEKGSYALYYNNTFLKEREEKKKKESQEFVEQNRKNDAKRVAKKKREAEEAANAQYKFF